MSLKVLNISEVGKEISNPIQHNLNSITGILFVPTGTRDKQGKIRSKGEHSKLSQVRTGPFSQSQTFISCMFYNNAIFTDMNQQSLFLTSALIRIYRRSCSKTNPQIKQTLIFSKQIPVVCSQNISIITTVEGLLEKWNISKFQSCLFNTDFTVHIICILEQKLHNYEKWHNLKNSLISILSWTAAGNPTISHSLAWIFLFERTEGKQCE